MFELRIEPTLSNVRATWERLPWQIRDCVDESWICQHTLGYPIEAPGFVLALRVRRMVAKEGKDMMRAYALRALLVHYRRREVAEFDRCNRGLFAH